jgi:hypothetical protein
MLTLAAADTIAGAADAATKVTVTIFGMTLNGTTEAYSVLYQGQLGATAATIYTVPGSTQAFVRSITVVNTDTSAAHTFQLFRGGTAASNAITPIYTLAAGGMATYEDGLGWSINTVTVGNALLNDTHSGYSDYSAISSPAAPAADTLRFYARKVSGRMVPKWTPPSGVDTPFQAALWGNNVVMYVPNTGTTAGINLGAPWAVGTTIGHPQPTAGMYTQLKRTTSTNVVTTTNQLLGVSSIVSTAAQFWVGNSAGLGGFFFFARFGIETLTAASPNATRLFVGLQSGTTSILASDTVPAISCVGLWHDTTDGANVINLLTKDGTTATKNALTGSPTTPYSTGQGYDFYLFCKPADSTIYYRLDNLNTGAILVDSSVTTTIPNNAVFMGPVCGMSNGTANIVASTVAIGVNRVYVESDH